MIVDVGNWMGIKVDHYMEGFLQPCTETGNIIGIALSEDATDFIVDLQVDKDTFRKARLSMCLLHGKYKMINEVSVS